MTKKERGEAIADTERTIDRLARNFSEVSDEELAHMLIGLMQYADAMHIGMGVIQGNSGVVNQTLAAGIELAKADNTETGAH